MAYQALYREWRPKKFEDVVAQQRVVKTLKNQILSGKIGHAYLFNGPRGIGKTTLAKIYAKAINCLNPIDGNPCGECLSCLSVESPDNMDIIEIDAASNNGVDAIRELRNNVKFAPAVCRYKVFIIDEVHMLSVGAFNALLKTLEEPPEHAVFILATTEPHKIPETVISRCQRYDFGRIGVQDIVDRLKLIAEHMKCQVEEEAYYTIALWSEGGMRDAIGMLDQAITYNKDIITVDDVLSITGGSGNKFLVEVVDAIIERQKDILLTKIRDLADRGKDFGVFVHDLLSHIRNLLIVKICSDSVENPLDEMLNTTKENIELYKKQAVLANENLLLRAIDILSELRPELRNSTQQRILVEFALFQICSPQADENTIAMLYDKIDVLEKKIENIKVNGVKQEKIKEDKTEVIDDDFFGQIPPPDDEEIYMSNVQKNNIETKTESIKEKPKENKETEKTEKAKKENKPEKNNLSIMDCGQIWMDVLARIKKVNTGAYMIYKKAMLTSSKDNKICIMFEEKDKGVASIASGVRFQTDLLSVYKEVTGQTVTADINIGEYEKVQEDKQPKKKDEEISTFGNLPNDMIEILD